MILKTLLLYELMMFSENDFPESFVPFNKDEDNKNEL
jgi:hypothetical protein